MHDQIIANSGLGLIMGTKSAEPEPEPVLAVQRLRGGRHGVDAGH